MSKTTPQDWASARTSARRTAARKPAPLKPDPNEPPEWGKYRRTEHGGMAWWPATGPTGESCETCGFFRKTKKQSKRVLLIDGVCLKAMQLRGLKTARKVQRIEPFTPACREWVDVKAPISSTSISEQNSGNESPRLFPDLPIQFRR